MTTNGTDHTKIGLITGANRGIGYETARLLGERMKVLVGARDEQQGRTAEVQLRETGADVHFVQLDVTDEASITAAAKHIEEEFGRLDVLVNNAGIVRVDGKGLPSETTLETLRAVYETNVFGVVVVTNALLPLLRRAPAARIVNVSSEVGSISSMTNPQGPMWDLTSATYPSSKTALNMITAMYAKELRDTPIKVNAANPGYCATDFNGQTGFRTATQGAEVSVHLATLDIDGPTGLLWGDKWADGQTGVNGALTW